MEDSQSLPVKIQDEMFQQRIYLMFDGAGNGTQGLAKAHRALCTELHSKTILILNQNLKN